jgi:glycosyltransferase involved in cell wall biosynthesis
MIEISVIIPTYNRKAALRACLEALGRQTLPATTFEVIVVVDGATDGTTDMLRRLSTPYRLHVIAQPNSGVGQARNQGIAAASGAYCLFVDDDIIADPPLLERHLAAQQAGGGIVGLGDLTFDLPRRADGFARYLAGWWRRHYEKFRRGVRPPNYMDCYSGNLSAPRAALLAVGGYATDLVRSEDVELGYRLDRHGLAFVYIADATGRQEYRKGFRQIAADAERAGSAGVELYRRHPPMLTSMQLGAFAETSRREILLRRLLLRLHIAPGLLAVAGAVIERTSRAQEWYRFLADYCYWRGVRRSIPSRETWHRLTGGPLILMYHAIADDDEPASRYILARRSLARQMRWLRLARYHVLSMGELVQLRARHELPPLRAVVLTFDDGYADNRRLAYPILRQHNFPAMFFIVSGLIGAINRWDDKAPVARRPLLGWPDIKAIQGEQISIGAHTRTHPWLTNLIPADAEREISGSRADLEHELGQPVTVFAYPYGDMDGTTQTLVQEAGFAVACSTLPGHNSPATASMALRRTEIYGTMSLLHFALTLALGGSIGFLDRRDL